MTSAPDIDELAQFLSKALDIQLSDPDEPLTEEVLAKMARNAGLSDEDWKRVCSKLEEHLQKGRNFLRFENYEDAVVELDQAVALAPYRAGVLCDCGKAHLRNWKEAGVKASRDRSEDLLLKTLEIDPANVEAARLLSEHRKPAPVAHGRGKKMALAAAALALAATAWVALTNPQRDAGNGSGAPIMIETQSGPIEGLQDSTWEWESGGDLVLKADGTATHSEWRREGAWSLNPDGSLFLEAPTGTFRIEFRDGVGHVRHLQRGGGTTIVRKR
ncbi:MAG: hypothetical protein P1U86_12080 [Verrucomicrobiales bacterium]|nr:hypothetical protein [Verrucomicrobiales bacterium]